MKLFSTNFYSNKILKEFVEAIYDEKVPTVGMTVGTLLL